MADEAAGGADPGRPTAPAPPGLPAPLTRLIGRAADVDRVAALLRDPAVRLVTVTGPGGVGKSRVAIEAAAVVRAGFPDGVTMARLAALTDPALVLPTIADGVGVSLPGGRPPADALADVLRGQDRLLLLDGFEPVAAAADRLADLLRACPSLTALVTSRVRLRVRGERVVEIGPLALPKDEPPDPEGLLASPAVALLVERARDGRPDFALTAANAAAVAAIVRRLDGLPLAVELAAAWLSLLTPEAMLPLLDRRLSWLAGGGRDLPERHRTMREAIAWSDGLLRPGQREVLRRVAVFAGGCSLPAAAAVAGRDEAAAFDDLSALVDASLLRRAEAAGGDGPRFELLDTVREYGVEQLAAAGEEPAVRQRHAGFFAAFAEGARPFLDGPEQDAWIGRLVAERDNLRAALAWACAVGDADTALRLGAALWRAWYQRGDLAEGRRWLEQALALAGDAPDGLRAEAMVAAGHFAGYQGDHDRAAEHLTAALALARRVGAAEALGGALFALGVHHEDRGAFDPAWTALEEAAAVFAASGDRSSVAWTRYHLGVVAFGRGDLGRARDLLDEAREGAAAAGDPFPGEAALACLGLVLTDLGNHRGAAAALLESLAMARDKAHPEAVARNLGGCAVLAAERGRPDLAGRLIGATAALADRYGFVVASPERERFVRAAGGSLPHRQGFGDDGSLDDATVTGAIVEAIGFARAVRADADAPPAGRAAATGRPAVADAAAVFGLTARELEVLRLVAQGKTNPDIGAILGIAGPTVRTHVSSILGKLDARSRTAAALTALDHGLV